MLKILHRMFGTHRPDPAHNHWQRGQFTSVCIRCGRHMVQLPGLPWRAGRAE